MGRIYRPVEVEYGNRKATTVAIIDTGADETVISERLAGKVNSDLYGVFKAICASDTILEGKYADVMIRELWSGVEIVMTVGVSDKPFSTDDIDDEGVEAILGVDFLQETEMPLDFGY
jgi:predicted aspartyl protease